MEVTAKTKFARMSPRKVRNLAAAIQGLPVADALKITEFSERKGAMLIGKTLKSVIANAENNAKLSADTLRVKEAVVEPGPSLKRFWPRARGSASPILKRTCHIKITLSDEA
jgi:large subunit ribosomal protein L22